jgi:hypothetical protein
MAAGAMPSTRPAASTAAGFTRRACPEPRRGVTITITMATPSAASMMLGRLSVWTPKMSPATRRSFRLKAEATIPPPFFDAAFVLRKRPDRAEEHAHVGPQLRNLRSWDRL